MKNITEKNTKAEILDGAMEYIAHLEETRHTKECVRGFTLMAFVIGLFAGLGI